MKLILPDTRFGKLDEIEKIIKKERDSRLTRRLNGIRLLLKGYRQDEVASILGVSRVAVSGCVKKWNEGGREALKTKSFGSKSEVVSEIRAEISEIIDVKKEITGKVVTGKLIHGYIKKTQLKDKLFANLLCYQSDGVCEVISS